MEQVKLDPARLAAVVSRIVSEIRESLKELKGARGIFAIAATIPGVVLKVEAIGQELNLLGSDKKEIAVAAVLLLVPDRWISDAMLRPFVSWAIERALPEIKKRLGK